MSCGVPRGVISTFFRDETQGRPRIGLQKAATLKLAREIESGTVDALGLLGLPLSQQQSREANRVLSGALERQTAAIIGFEQSRYSLSRSKVFVAADNA